MLSNLNSQTPQFMYLLVLLPNICLIISCIHTRISKGLKITHLIYSSLSSFDSMLAYLNETATAWCSQSSYHAYFYSIHLVTQELCCQFGLQIMR